MTDRTQEHDELMGLADEFAQAFIGDYDARTAGTRRDALSRRLAEVLAAPKEASTERPGMADLANSFYVHIAHGDEKHREWLKRETEAWFKTHAWALIPAKPDAAHLAERGGQEPVAWHDKAMRLVQVCENDMHDFLSHGGKWEEVVAAREALSAHLRTVTSPSSPPAPADESQSDA